MSDREVHLLDHVRMLYKRRHTVLAIFSVVVVGATVYTFTAIPIYQARTRLLIEPDNPNVVSFKAVIDEDQAKAEYSQTQYNILQSRALARRTLDQLALSGVPPFAGDAVQAVGVSSLVARALEYVHPSQGTATTSTAPRSTDETAAQSKAIDIFLAHLTIAPVRNTRLVDVAYDHADPPTAARIVNALARNYIEQDLEYRFNASKEASDWLGQRLAEERNGVETAEARLQQYREQNGAISLEHRENIVVQKLADLNAAVTRAKTERIQKEAMFRQLERAQVTPALLDTFPAIMMNSFIQQQKAELADLQRQHAQLAEKLGTRHPDIVKINTAMQLSQQKLSNEIAKAVLSVKSEYEAALTQERSLSSALDAQKGEALAMNRKAIDYGALERDAESSKQIYQSLLQRAKETGVSGELKTSNIRIVDVAERPRNPIRPQKTLTLLLALIGGGILACGGAFLFEYVDSRIKTPDEISTHLGLSHIGLLPSVDPKSGSPLLSTGVPANFKEAFAAIRTNVLFSSAQEGARSVVITSTGPREGKSMVACNLAISLAQAGQRVLLIDADMRKPTVHEVFEQSQEPGLSNLLVGNVKASEAIRKSPVAGLWMITAGAIPPNPAELLGSQRSREFIASLKDHFEWVIIDSPPVMAVTDAALVAHYASGVLFVVGAEMTSRHAAKRALDQLEHAQAKFVGAVLNRVDLERDAYYYSHYYRREYSTYYTSSATP